MACCRLGPLAFGNCRLGLSGSKPPCRACSIWSCNIAGLVFDLSKWTIESTACLSAPQQVQIGVSFLPLYIYTCNFICIPFPCTGLSCQLEDLFGKVSSRLMRVCSPQDLPTNDPRLDVRIEGSGLRLQLNVSFSLIWKVKINSRRTGEPHGATCRYLYQVQGRFGEEIELVAPGTDTTLTHESASILKTPFETSMTTRQLLCQ